MAYTPGKYRGPPAWTSGPSWRCAVKPCPTTQNERQPAKDGTAALLLTVWHHQTYHRPPTPEEPSCPDPTPTAETSSAWQPPPTRRR